MENISAIIKSIGSIKQLSYFFFSGNMSVSMKREKCEVFEENYERSVQQ